MKVGRGKRRVAISELVATIVTIAITLVAGAAVFGFVNGQAGVTERQYGQSVAGTVNYLQEKFAVVDMNYSSTGNAVTIWFYNNGAVAFSPVQILVYNVSRSEYLLYNATKIISYKPNSCTTTPVTTSNEKPIIYNANTNTGLAVPIQGFQSVTLTLPSCSGASFKSGHTYDVNIVGLYGNDVIYYQVR